MDVRNLKDSSVLTDNSQLIEHKVKQVNDVVSNIKHREGFFGIDLPKLTSWLPSTPGLQETFIDFILVISFSIVACCCIQCAYLCRSAIRCIPNCTPRPPPDSPMLNSDLIEMR